MSLRRLGLPLSEQFHNEQIAQNGQSAILKEMRRFNDYMALMTNETSPPTEEDDTDATT